MRKAFITGTAGFIGYHLCRRLLADDEPRFSARALAGRALQILECPSGETCETSCPHCLNDFSNQQHWDKLNRHPVRAWLSGVLSQTQARPAQAPADVVPIANISAIYARENGQGMAFPVSDEESLPAALSAVDSPALERMDTEDKPETPSPSNPGRPALKRIK